MWLLIELRYRTPVGPVDVQPERRKEARLLRLDSLRSCNLRRPADWRAHRWARDIKLER